VTLLAAAAIFGVIMTRTGWRYQTRLGSGIAAAMAAPMIFELPFDLIVMTRTYPALPPDPALYRAVFFTPLFLVELTTLSLLTLSPMVRLRKSTFFCFALMTGVYGIWALSGFGYPQSALPITMNVVSKILAFATALTLFLPDRPRNWRTDGPAPAPTREQTPQPATAAPAPGREQAPQLVMAPSAAGREQIPQLVMAAPVLTVQDATRPNGKVKEGGMITRATDAATVTRVTDSAGKAAVSAGKAAVGGPAIRVLGLRKSFGQKAAVAGIDLEIAPAPSPGWSDRTGLGRPPHCR
jgi:hypothetical protein